MRELNEKRESVEKVMHEREMHLEKLQVRAKYYMYVCTLLLSKSCQHLIGVCVLELGKCRSDDYGRRRAHEARSGSDYL